MSRGMSRRTSEGQRLWKILGNSKLHWIWIAIESGYGIEQEIDELVYQLYGLTDAEIELIKQTYRDAGMEV